MVVREGWLKRRSRLAAWRKVYVRLDAHALVLFNRENDAAPKTSLSLGCVRVRWLVSSRVLSRRRGTSLEREILELC